MFRSILFQVSGHLHNTGQFVVFRADRDSKVRVNITGGPLAYHYQFEEIYIHYGMDNAHGSEHRVNNYAFPAEVRVKIFLCIFQLWIDTLYKDKCNRQRKKNAAVEMICNTPPPPSPISLMRVGALLEYFGFPDS